MNNSGTSKLKNRRGFTLAELLVTVAIIMILMGFAFVGVNNYRKRLKRVELDNIAREIYVAAQNHMTAAQATGKWSVFVKKNTADSSKIALLGIREGDGDTYHLDEKDRKKANTTAASLLLPSSAVEEDILSDGHYYVQYDAKKGSILNVYYSEKEMSSFADVSGFATGEGNKSNREKKSVGWYGATNGDLGAADAQEKMKAPVVTVRNAESLVLYIIDPNYGKDASNVSISVKGASSAKEVTHKLVPVGGDVNPDMSSASENWSVAVETITSDNNRTITLEDGTTENSYRIYTVVLDSIMIEGGHFKQLFPELEAGENIEITATVSNSSNTEEVSSSVKVNSLFEDKKDHTVYVSNVRHLENLSTNISGQVSAQDDAQGLSVEITEDLTWSDDGRPVPFTPHVYTGSAEAFLEAIRKSDTSYSYDSLSNMRSIDKISVYSLTGEKASENKFVPIMAGNIKSVEGNGHILTGFDITESFAAEDGSVAAGLFANTSAGSSISNLTLRNTRVVSENGKNVSAGTLVGMVGGSLTLKNISAVTTEGDRYLGGVYNFTTATSGMTSGDVSSSVGVYSASGPAGGLIGSTSAAEVTIENSYASLPVYSGNEGTNKIAGGLVGSTQNITITNSFVGGYVSAQTVNADTKIVELSDYTKSTINVAAPGGQAGGLIGVASGNVKTENVYTTASVSGTTAGGFIGSASNLGLTASYSTGRVYAVNSGSGENNATASANNSVAQVGKFAGYVGGKITTDNPKEDTNADASEDKEATASKSMKTGVLAGVSSENSESSGDKSFTFPTNMLGGKKDSKDANPSSLADIAAEDLAANAGNTEFKTSFKTSKKVLTRAYSINLKGDYPYPTGTTTSTDSTVIKLAGGDLTGATKTYEAGAVMHFGDWPILKASEESNVVLVNDAVLYADILVPAENIAKGKKGDMTIMVVGETSKNVDFFVIEKKNADDEPSHDTELVVKRLDGGYFRQNDYQYKTVYSYIDIDNGSNAHTHAIITEKNTSSDAKEGDKTYRIYLDDITLSDGHFERMCQNLIPGEDIKIFALTGTNIVPEKELKEKYLDAVVPTTNSLFGNESTYSTTTALGKAQIINGRHLQNLDVSCSKVFIGKYYPSGINDIKKVMFNMAYLDSDIDWSEFKGEVAEIKENKDEQGNAPNINVYNYDGAKGADNKFIGIQSWYQGDGNTNIGIEIFNGNGNSSTNIISKPYTISNLDIEPIGASENIGLFRSIWTNSFTIQNVNFENLTVKTNTGNAGGLIGYLNAKLKEGCYIKNVNISGNVDIESKGNNAGGVIGSTESMPINIQNTVFEGNISVKGTEAGGFVGYNLENAGADGTIKGSGITDSSISGYLSVHASNGNAGGVIGNQTGEVKIGEEASDTGEAQDGVRITGTLDISANNGAAAGIIANNNGGNAYIYNSEVTFAKTAVNGAPTSSKISATGLAAGVAGNAGAITIKETYVSTVDAYNAEIHSNNEVAGGVIGRSYSYITVEDVYAVGKNLIISNSSSSAVGGAIGYMATGSVKNTAAAAYVISTSTGSAGGFVGYSQGATIENSYAGGHTKDGKYQDSKTGEGRYNVQSLGKAGGFIGEANSTTIRDSYTTASVYGGQETGGFIGNGGSTLLRNYSTGLVNGADASKVGLFAGNNYNDYDLNSDDINYFFSGVNSGTNYKAFGTGKASAVERSILAAAVATRNASNPYDKELEGSTYPYQAVNILKGIAHYGDWPSIDKVDVEVINDEILYVRLKPERNKKLPKDITLLVYGETSDRYELFNIVMSTENGRTQTIESITRTGMKWENEQLVTNETETFNMSQNPHSRMNAVNAELYLDDITVIDNQVENGSFSKMLPTLFPGENIKVLAYGDKLELNAASLSAIAPDLNNAESHNSLFADTSKIVTSEDATVTAKLVEADIANMRHLQNLDNGVSAINSTTSANAYGNQDKVYTTTAKLTADIDQNTFRTKVNRIKGTTGSLVRVKTYKGGLSETNKIIGIYNIALSSLDGQNHTISNLNIDNRAQNTGLTGDGSDCYSGLFRKVMPGMSISNLILENVKVNGQTTGGLIAVTWSVSPKNTSTRDYSEVKLSNIHLTGNIDVDSKDAAGGIVGVAETKVRIANSSIEGNLDVLQEENGSNKTSGAGFIAFTNQDVHIENSIIEGTVKIQGNADQNQASVGAFIGQEDSGSSKVVIKNSSIQFTGNSSITTAKKNAGVIVGCLIGDIEIENTSVTSTDSSKVSISAGSDAGGFIGYAQNGIKITDSLIAGKDFEVRSTGSKGAEYRAGGMIGYSEGKNSRILEIENSAASVYVIAQGATSSAGGFAGKLNAGKASTISNSYAGGHTSEGVFKDSTEGVGRYNVVSAGTAGGFVGAFQSDKFTIDNCYATTSVNGNKAGGFVGDANSSTVKDSYAAGLVKGKTAGLFAGTNNHNYQNNYSNYYLSGINKYSLKDTTSGNRIANSKTLTEMMAMDAASETSMASTFDSTLDDNYPFSVAVRLNAIDHYGDWQLPTPISQKLKFVNGNKLELHMAIPSTTGNVTLSLTGKNSAGVETTVYALLTINTDGSVSRTEFVDTKAKLDELMSNTSKFTKNFIKTETVSSFNNAQASSAISSQLPAQVGGRATDNDYAIVFTLDDVTTQKGSFENICNLLAPGTDITARVNEGWGIFDLSSETGVSANSLYANGSKYSAANTTAKIANIRHLENLDPKISAIGSTSVAAVQMNNLTWDTGMQIYTNADTSNATKASTGEFIGIINGALSSYDGRNYTISNLKVGNSRGDAGLFAQITGNTTIRNLTLENAVVSTTTGDAGALVGKATSTLTAEYVFSVGENAEVTTNNGYAGGLIGSMTGGSVENTGVSAYVKGTTGAGGLIGKVSGTSISTSYSGGRTQNEEYKKSTTGAGRYNVTATANAGGFIGVIEGTSTVTKSYSSSSVNVTNGNAGGFAGQIASSARIGEAGTGNYVYSTGLVSGNGTVGNFAGKGNGANYQNTYYLSGINTVSDELGRKTDLNAIGNMASNPSGVNAAAYDSSDNPLNKLPSQSVSYTTKAYDASYVDAEAEYPYISYTKVKTGSNLSTHYGDWQNPIEIRQQYMVKFLDENGAVIKQWNSDGEEVDYLLIDAKSGVTPPEKTDNATTQMKFNGWYKVDSETGNVTDKKVNSVEFASVRQDLTVQAKYDRYVEFREINPVTGENKLLATRTVDAGKKVTVPNHSTYMSNGYTFSGWYIASTVAKDKLLTIENNTVTVVDNLKTIYALYVEYEDYEVIIKYVDEANEKVFEPTTITVETKINQDVALPIITNNSMEPKSVSIQYENGDDLNAQKRDSLKVEERNFNPNSGKIHISNDVPNKTKVYTITYKSETAPYIVRHIFRNSKSADGTIDGNRGLVDENIPFDEKGEAYIDETLEGTVGSATIARSLKLTADQQRKFRYSEIGKQEDIKADGSTVVNVYYDRQSYYVVYKTDTNATYLPETAYYYGQTISLGTAEDVIRPGNTLRKWRVSFTGNAIEEEIYEPGGSFVMSVPSSQNNTVTVTADWKEAEKADYTVEYYRQNVNDAVGLDPSDKTYEYISSMKYSELSNGVLAEVGKIIGKDSSKQVDTTERTLLEKVPSDLTKESAYLKFNDANTYNKDVVVKADGSTVFKVYFDRKPQTLIFHFWNVSIENLENIEVGPEGNKFHYIFEDNGNITYSAQNGNSLYRWKWKESIGADGKTYYTLGYQILSFNTKKNGVSYPTLFTDDSKWENFEYAINLTEKQKDAFMSYSSFKGGYYETLQYVDRDDKQLKTFKDVYFGVLTTKQTAKEYTCTLTGLYGSSIYGEAIWAEYLIREKNPSQRINSNTVAYKASFQFKDEITNAYAYEQSPLWHLRYYKITENGVEEIYDRSLTQQVFQANPNDVVRGYDFAGYQFADDEDDIDPSNVSMELSNGTFYTNSDGAYTNVFYKPAIYVVKLDNCVILDEEKAKNIFNYDEVEFGTSYDTIREGLQRLYDAGYIAAPEGKEEYQFLGWYDTSDSSAELEWKATGTMQDNTLRLFAHWKAPAFEIQLYEKNGNSEILHNTLHDIEQGAIIESILENENEVYRADNPDSKIGSWYYVKDGVSKLFYPSRQILSDLSSEKNADGTKYIVKLYAEVVPATSFKLKYKLVDSDGNTLTYKEGNTVKEAIFKTNDEYYVNDFYAINLPAIPEIDERYYPVMDPATGTVTAADAKNPIAITYLSREGTWYYDIEKIAEYTDVHDASKKLTVSKTPENNNPSESESVVVYATDWLGYVVASGSSEQQTVNKPSDLLTHQKVQFKYVPQLEAYASTVDAYYDGSAHSVEFRFASYGTEYEPAAGDYTLIYQLTYKPQVNSTTAITEYRWKAADGTWQTTGNGPVNADTYYVDAKAYITQTKPANVTSDNVASEISKANTICIYESEDISTVLVRSVNITIVSNSDEWKYDGNAHRDENYNITTGEVVGNDRLTVNFTSSSFRQEPGTSRNDFSVSFADGTVATNYNIMTSKGNLKVYWQTTVKQYARYTCFDQEGNAQEIIISLGDEVVSDPIYSREGETVQAEEISGYSPENTAVTLSYLNDTADIYYTPITDQISLIAPVDAVDITEVASTENLVTIDTSANELFNKWSGELTDADGNLYTKSVKTIYTKGDVETNVAPTEPGEYTVTARFILTDNNNPANELVVLDTADLENGTATLTLVWNMTIEHVLLYGPEKDQDNNAIQLEEFVFSTEMNTNITDSTITVKAVDLSKKTDANDKTEHFYGFELSDKSKLNKQEQTIAFNTTDNQKVEIATNADVLGKKITYMRYDAEKHVYRVFYQLPMLEQPQVDVEEGTIVLTKPEVGESLKEGMTLLVDLMNQKQQELENLDDANPFIKTEYRASDDLEEELNDEEEVTAYNLYLYKVVTIYKDKNNNHELDAGEQVITNVDQEASDKASNKVLLRTSSAIARDSANASVPETNTTDGTPSTSETP